MPLDLFSALFIAASVVQFVDFGLEVVSKGKKVYKAGDRASEENTELKIPSTRLRVLSSSLKSGLQDGAQGPLSASDQALEDVCTGYITISNELASKLEGLQIAEGIKHREWESLRKALKSVWLKEKIEEVSNRLERFRSELDTHALIELRSNVNLVKLQQEERFNSLDATTQCAVALLFETGNNMSQLSRDVEENLHCLSVSNIVEHTKTREVFLEQAEQRYKRKVELAILESLRFPTMTYRHETIPEAYQRTFEWIFLDSDIEGKPWSNFSQWLRGGNGIYWIHGKAGSGKSTLIKFIVDHPKTQNFLKSWSHGEKPESPAFFFWNSGPTDERSHAGLLRSLLYEILQRHINLIYSVFQEEREKSIELTRHNLQLTLGSRPLSILKRYFERLVNSTSERLRFCFFIDGLDE